jgi:hypothetical protein
MTEKLNEVHYHVLSEDFSALRQKIFDHACAPRHGANVSLKADLIFPIYHWSKVAKAPCPITFTEDEQTDCLYLNDQHIEADGHMQACKDVIGIGPEGWVPVEQYEEMKECEMRLKAAMLAAIESEEAQEYLREHWILGNFDEKEYE